MSATILNRSFEHPADGWYQIEPKGNHRNDKAGVVQVIDDRACEAIVAAFNRDALKPGFAGMLIDREHFRHDTGKETRAFGWLRVMDRRPDGIYARIDWTGSGQSAVDNGDYRFFSTEYDGRDFETVRAGHVRPMRLAGLTLTNMPNNRGGKPITVTNREPVSQGVVGLQPLALEKFTKVVNTIQERSGKSFADSWVEAQQIARDLFAMAQTGFGDPLVLNREVELPYDSLDELEPRARDFVRRAWRGEIAWPNNFDFNAFWKRFKQFQVAHPDYGFERLWELFRNQAEPTQLQSFWKFVELFANPDAENLLRK